jgi:hypothetical protein
MNLLRRVARLNAAEFALLAAAVLRLARMRLALTLLPWPRMLALANPTAGMPPPRLTVEQLEWAVQWASRVVPRATCLTQALALNHLLRREGHACTVQIGANSDGGRFTAHAWVECNGVPLLSSASEIGRYSRFPAWPATQPDPFQ